MSPGPKKHGASRKTEQKVDARTTKNSCMQSQKPDDKVSEIEGNNEFEVVDKRYQKRKIVSNLNRYEEPVVDSHADVSRGSDYEVLLSYSGGAGSQHRFLEEKEWEDSIDGMDLTIDFAHLSESLKCIPFYKRLHLPKDIFEPAQINKMDKASEQSLQSFSSLIKSQSISNGSSKRMQSASLNKPEPFAEEDSMFQIENNHSSVDNVIESQVPIIQTGTEKFIESLASCLTLETRSELKTNSSLKAEPTQGLIKDSASNELDILLSLSAGNSNSRRNIDVKSTLNNANVDEWLNSILEN